MDAVISWGVIEHDEAGPDRALAEFHRILAAAGVVSVTVPTDSERSRQASKAQFPVEPGAPRVFFQYFMTQEELASYAFHNLVYCVGRKPGRARDVQ